MLTNSGTKVIVNGQNHKLLVKVIQGEVIPELDELVVTTNDAKIVPANIIIGRITKIEGKYIEVTPVFNPRNTDIVSVLSKEE